MISWRLQPKDNGVLLSIEDSGGGSRAIIIFGDPAQLRLMLGDMTKAIEAIGQEAKQAMPEAFMREYPDRF